VTAQPSLFMFAIFVGITLVVTAWASGQSRTSRGFYAANRRIGGLQNGWAIAGDYVSAASFLGITGLIAFYGFDGFMYSVGWLVAYLAVLLLVAEPLRNVGKYTVADLMSFRLRGRGVRAIAAISTLAITLFYLIAQMVGVSALVNLLLPRFEETIAVVGVGVLMLVYVLFGGMLATTWVQIIKAGMLLATAIGLSLLAIAHFHFSLTNFFGAAAAVPGGGGASNLLQPGLLFHGSLGAWNLVSLGLALVLGTAGLPHILMRFYTVPSARAARTSVAWAMVLVGIFYLTTSFMGLGAATIVGKDHIGRRMSAGQAIGYIARHPAQASVLNTQLRSWRSRSAVRFWRRLWRRLPSQPSSPSLRALRSRLRRLSHTTYGLVWYATAAAKRTSTSSWPERPHWSSEFLRSCSPSHCAATTWRFSSDWLLP
jgi:cation/acetate symporter